MAKSVPTIPTAPAWSILNQPATGGPKPLPVVENPAAGDLGFEGLPPVKNPLPFKTAKRS